MFFYLLTRFLKYCQENNRTVFGSGKVPQQFYGTSMRYAMVKTIGPLILIMFIHYNNNIVNNDSGKINCRKHFHGLQAPCLYARTNLMYSYKSNENKQAKYIYRLYWHQNNFGRQTIIFCTLYAHNQEKFKSLRCQSLPVSVPKFSNWLIKSS